MTSEMDGVHPYPVSAGRTPEGAARRRAAARIANFERWAHEGDRQAATAAARAAFEKKFEDAVDPERVLPAEERARRAALARRAHFTRMAVASAKARAAKKKSA